VLADTALRRPEAPLRRPRAAPGATVSWSGSRPLPILLFAIDEAQLRRRVGHDFRPEYAKLGSSRYSPTFRSIAPPRPPATARPAGTSFSRLGSQLPPATWAGFDRPNIRYSVVEEDKSRFIQLAGFSPSPHGGGPASLCLSRKRVEEVANKLVASGVKAAAYHAGLPDKERHRVQDAFLKDDLMVVVADGRLRPWG